MNKNCYNCIHKVNGGTFCGFTEEVCELYDMEHPLHLISYNHSHPEICDRWKMKGDKLKDESINNG